MKRFTSKQVSKWIAAGNLINKERAPKPFPGRAPTRIMLNSLADNKSFRYLGKPSKAIFHEYVKFARQPTKNLNLSFTMYAEFDRGGIVTYSKYSPNFGNSGKTNVNLWAHYHSEVMVAPYPNWLKYKWKVVNGKYKIA